jgi:hypothetical protein
MRRFVVPVATATIGIEAEPDALFRVEEIGLGTGAAVCGFTHQPQQFRVGDRHYLTSVSAVAQALWVDSMFRKAAMH